MDSGKIIEEHGGEYYRCEIDGQKYPVKYELIRPSDVVKNAKLFGLTTKIKPVDAISNFNTIAANLGHPINQLNKYFIEKNIGIVIKMVFYI